MVRREFEFEVLATEPDVPPDGGRKADSQIEGKSAQLKL
jgi:hypothetical protein